MFKVPTAIIIGAGASKDFDYPLGPELLSEIVDGLARASDKLSRASYIDVSMPSPDVFLQRRYEVLYNLAAANKRQLVPYSQLQMDDFVNTAKGQTQNSIDRFLRDHREHSEVGKFLIAFELACCSYTGKNNSGHITPENFSYPNKLKWVSGLINEIREGARNAEELKANNLTIITFNYDDILERAFDAQIANTSSHKGAVWREFAKIEHVYGRLDKLPSILSTSALFELAHASAPSLGYIHEQAGVEAFEERIRRLRHLLRNAQRVISLGFSFDQANVELLDLDISIGQKMIALNYDGNIGLKSVLAKLYATEFVDSNRGKEISISKAIDLGILRY